jgi:hypothetical protein
MPDERRSVGVRVRPNSHDFIRQLRQDLKSKSYTFYADVRANTAPATRDVRTWASTTLQKINASVQVSANTGPATRDMADWRRRQAGIRTTVNVHADTSAALREIEAVRAAAKDVTIRVKADADRVRRETQRQAGNAKSSDLGGMLDLAAEKRAIQRFSRNVDQFIRQQRPFQGVGDSLTREISDAMSKASGKKVRLDVDDTPARKTMRDLLEQFQDTGNQKTKFKVDLELDDSFDYRLRRKLADIKAKTKADPVELPIEADIKDLERQIMASRIIEKSKSLKVPVEYDATDIRQMRLQLQKLRLMEEANDIKLRVQVSRSSLEQAKDAMEGVSKQFGGFNLIRSLDVGPFNLGKPSGLIGTVSTLTILAGLLPGVTAGAMALADGLTRIAGAAALAPGALGALAASLSTLTIGTMGIGDAFDSMFAMWDEGASQQGKSAAKLVSAQNNYKNAVVDEGRAQERVATARRQALGELRNLNNELRGGVLNEAQALLDLQKARDRYAQGGFENATDQQQALLDIQRAELNVSTSREDNIALQQKANDANAKGVEGSDLVRDALDGQRRAADATAQALESLSAGGAGATTAAQKFQDQLSQLSPNAQDFVMTIAGFKDEMYGFRNAIQDTIFQGAGPAFADMFNDLLPVVQPGMERIAQGLNSNLLQVFDTLKSPDGQSIIERILGGTADTQEAISGLIDPLVRGLGTLTAAGAEHMPQLVDLFTNFADRFAIFIEKADANGSLDEFLDKGIGALADMAEIGLNVIQIVNDLSDAFGGNILTDIKSLTDSWHAFLSSEEGQAKLRAFLQEAKDLWAEWKPVIMEIPGAFAAVSEAAQNVLGYLLPTIENILGFLNQFPGGIEAIATALIVSKLLGSFSTLAKTVGAIWTALSGMPGLINKIPGVNIPGLPTPGADPKGGGKGGLGGGFLAANPGLVTAAVATAAIPAVASVANNAAQNQQGQGDINSVNAQLPKEAPPIAGTNKDSNQLRALKSLAEGGDPVAQWILAAAPPDALGAPGLPFAGSMLIDPAAELDMAKRYLWAIQHPDQQGANFKPPPSYLTGGYTDWGAKTGRLAELHGGEYVQPKPTVAHYGKEAMEAVHQRKAVISYDAGGYRPMAYPGNDQTWYGPGIGGGLGSYVPGKHGHIPGATDGLGPYKSPFYDKRNKLRPPWGGQGGPFGTGPIGPPIISRQTGGPMVWDPNTQSFVETGAAVSHGQNPLGGGPGILGSVASGVTQGASTFASFASQAASPTGDAAVSPFGVTGAAPGPAATPTATTGGDGFTNSFLGALGIPGLGGQTTTSGPGWGDGGPPVGLGGGADGFDIRKFGIGPGPMGSGPNDWMKFAGSELGSFGSSFVSTLMSGVLGGLGLSGLSSYIGNAMGVVDHFATSATGSKAQGPGAAQTTADVNTLLGISAGMPGNPAYPGVGALPGVFDPSTGSALNPGGAGNGGLQTNTLRGKSAIQAAFPWATNIGGVRADNLKWHPQGLALDVMIPGEGGNNDPTSPKGLMMGNQVYAWLQQNKDALGIDYILWQKKDHFNHLHVNFAPSGYPAGGGPADVGTPSGLTPPIKSPAVGSQPLWGALPPPKQAPGAQPAPPVPSLTQKPALDNLKKIYSGQFDQGGWLMPGVTVVHNNTGRPEWAGPVPSYAVGGGFGTAALPVKPKPPTMPRPPDIQKKVQPPPPPTAAPKPSVPAITPEAPPVVSPPVEHGGTGAPPGPETPPAPQGPGGGQINLGPVRPATGGGPGAASGDHNHPALSKGITSGFAAAGNVAAMAASMGMAAGGGGGGGGMGGMISGLFGQAGKIANNVANVASSFLVGNITGGTTENPYGVTQRGSVPTGGSKVVDASNNQYGDVYTNNLDEYFKLQDRRNAQKAQSGLGRWGTQV